MANIPERPIVPVDTTVIMAEEEEDGCPRCGGKVRTFANSTCTS